MGGIYAFEPDSKNREKLAEYVRASGLDVKIIPCAAYDRVTELKFDLRGNNLSTVSESGTAIIPTETIDNVTQGKKVTFIKMNIEGSESYALKGAEQTIRKYHPKLAICAYHKKDDCLVLPEIIHSFYEGYKFYFRLHKPYAVCAVLYAVPPQD